MAEISMEAVERWRDYFNQQPSVPLTEEESRFLRRTFGVLDLGTEAEDDKSAPAPRQ